MNMRLAGLLVGLYLISAVQGAGIFSIGYYAYYEKKYVAPGAFPYNKITHVALAGVNVTNNGTVTIAGYVDNSLGWTTFVKEATALAHGNGTKTVLLVGGGGGNYGCPGNFNNATTLANVNITAQNIVSHARSFEFDGIDLDWETCIDWEALTRLAQKIRELWPKVFLTFPIGILEAQKNGSFTDPANYLPMMPYLDAVNMMSYSITENWLDWDGPWHLSPLKGNTRNHPYSIQLGFEAMIAKGIPRSKIGIGMGFFGVCWGSPITMPIQNMGTNHHKADDNVMSYRNIAALYKPNMTEYYDEIAEAPYLNSSVEVGPAGCTYISYDNDRSIKAKADFVKAQNLSGIIIWTLGEGCLPDGTNPSASSINNYFGRSYTPYNWPVPSATTTSGSTTSTPVGTSTTDSAVTTTSQASTTGASVVLFLFIYLFM